MARLSTLDLPDYHGISGESVACGDCGRIAATHDRFCAGCGAALTAACAGCGHLLAADAAFCATCGSALFGAAAATAERRRISVLFVDFVGFTGYAEHADPEVVRNQQTTFFAAARQVIGQYGGVIEKYIGDAVVAIFGAPVATESDAARAVQAGLHLQRALAGYAWPHAGAPRFRVAVATGEALVDLTEARNGGHAIVAGDVVNVAARLQSVAPPGSVLVCASTFASSRAAVRYERQVPVTLRGRSKPTEMWLALEALARPHPVAGREAAPLINRVHELSLLANALDRATRERIPQTVVVLGHAGTGKSRLVRELRQHRQGLGESGMRWHVGCCRPFGENVTYAALAEIVKTHAGIVDTASAEVVRARLDAAVRAMMDPAEVTRVVDALSALVGLPGPRLTLEECESAWRRFMVGLASQGPTVLVFEDLHLAAEPMLRFVELLGATVREGPLLVLCTARPELIERAPAWAAAIRGSLTVTLSPLRDADVAELYSHLLDGAVPAQMLDCLVGLAAGNPLYAHEYARMFREQAPLRPSLDGARNRVPLAMPETVQAIIANRLDLLEPAERLVLQAAAVVGTQFWPAAVAAAVGLPASAVHQALRRLEQRDLIHEQAASTLTMTGQPAYVFGHELVRDVCYQRLPRAERVARHSRIAQWLEGHQSGPTANLVDAIAYHRQVADELAGVLGEETSRYTLAHSAAAAANPPVVRLGSRRRAPKPCTTATRRRFPSRSVDLGDLGVEGGA